MQGWLRTVSKSNASFIPVVVWLPCLWHELYTFKKDLPWDRTPRRWIIHGERRVYKELPLLVLKLHKVCSPAGALGRKHQQENEEDDRPRTSKESKLQQKRSLCSRRGGHKGSSQVVFYPTQPNTPSFSISQNISLFQLWIPCMGWVLPLFKFYFTLLLFCIRIFFLFNRSQTEE